MYKKLRFFFRFSAAMLGKYYLAIGIGLVLGIILFVISPRLLPLLPRIRSTQSIAIVGRHTQTDIPLVIQNKISIGLTTISTDGSAAPALASAWETKDGGKTYVFTIDTNKKWQDGTSIKSHDIKYNFKDTTFEYPDDTHIVIRLNEPFSPLPVVVSRPVFKKALVGAGQYKVASSKRNGQILESITLVPTNSDSRLPKIRYLFYPSEQQAKTSFKLGLVQSIEEIQETADIATWPNVQLNSQPRYDRYVAIFFNTQDPFFSGPAGKNLRLALSYAVDKSRWQERAAGPLNPNSWAFNHELKTYDYDLPHSKDLLTRVEKVPTDITISTTSTYLSIAEHVKSDWEKLGIKSNIQVVPEVTSDFSVLIIAQAIPTDPDQYNLWHSTQGTNLTKFSNPRIDKYLEDGRKALEPKDRKEIYLNFQKFLVEEAPAIFLFHPTTYSLIRT